MIVRNAVTSMSTTWAAMAICLGMLDIACLFFRICAAKIMRLGVNNMTNNNYDDAALEHLILACKKHLKKNGFEHQPSHVEKNIKKSNPVQTWFIGSAISLAVGLVSFLIFASFGDEDRAATSLVLFPVLGMIFSAGLASGLFTGKDDKND